MTNNNLVHFGIWSKRGVELCGMKPTPRAVVTAAVADGDSVAIVRLQII